MKADIPNKILINRDEDGKIHHSYWTTDQQLIPFEDVEYIRKDMVVDAIKLAYGKVSMNPFDCSEAFEELLNKVGYEIH